MKQLWREGHEIALHTRDHVRLDPPINAEKEGEQSSRKGIGGLTCMLMA